MALYPLSRGLRAVFVCNILSSTLWFCCLGRFLLLLPLVGRRFLPAAIADFFHIVAVLPLVTFFVVNLMGRENHKSSDFWGLFNAARMVWICYGVIYPHPKIAKHTSYLTLILTWCILNLIDSTYYAFKVKTHSSPMWLFRLHHLHFFITAPVAIVSEMILIFLSGTYEKHHVYELFLDGCLIAYLPIAFFAFKHLLARKKDKYDDYLEKRRLGRSGGVELSGALGSVPNEQPEAGQPET
ncbi:hypothetical protein PUMCH_003292 [Australozyma saopauloensis]|uniref:very-long-chain (3R)-3-hydroxyacyl-CoA dehydratase n=1 Tax=Australozyma saopauloensis TaxID=291208 RepID=A0AAX4HBM5_9ASCO|nr:hypothetical protein PUMCH_003292 [[Candida] saopauloensis]